MLLLHLLLSRIIRALLLQLLMVPVLLLCELLVFLILFGYQLCLLLLVFLILFGVAAIDRRRRLVRLQIACMHRVGRVRCLIICSWASFGVVRRPCFASCNHVSAELSGFVSRRDG